MQFTLSTYVFLLLCVLSTLMGGAMAAEAAPMDAGDVIALILGLIIGFVVICAGLGWYSRRQ